MSKKRDIERFQDELEELFHDLWRVPRFSGLRHGFRPDVDCYRTEHPRQLVVVAELAGVDEQSLQIGIDEQALVISGLRPRPSVEGRPSYHQMEIEYGPFQRRVPLTEPVDAGQASASFENGLLTIVLPLAARPVPPDRVRITVRQVR
jgi:HSP20 family protein